MSQTSQDGAETDLPAPEADATVEPDSSRAAAPDTSVAVDSPPAQAPSATAEADAPPAQAPSAPAEPTPRRGQVRTLDFSQPTKFTAEFRRRLGRVLNPFCEAFAMRLSTELRTSVEITLGDSSQLTWAAAKAMLPANSVAVGLELAPIDKRMLLDVELPMVLQALECLVGGTASQAASERRLSEVDWALTRRLLDSLVLQLAPAWREFGGLELSLGDVDLDGDAGVLAPTGEPTFSLPLQVKIDGLPSTMTLLIPWSTIEPIASEILGTGKSSRDADPREGLAVNRGLAGAQVLLRAEIGSVQMPVERMLALTPGTLLELEDRAEHGVLLFAEGVAVGRGQPGLRGARRAIKLTGTMEPASASHAPSSLSPASLDRAHARTGGTRQALEGLARMLGVPVRVWAELGRTRIPLGRALELPAGTVVELDQLGDAPVELFVNGMCFAHGSLLVSAGGEWNVQVDTLV
jgi:flagellar motor switch protein FliM